MQCLLLAQELHQGQFVHQGLKYENLPNDILSIYTPEEQIYEAASSCDAVFILLHKLDLLDGLLAKVRLPNRNLPVFLLSHQYDQRAIEYVKNKQIEHFFVRPFGFRSIVNDAKTLVYKMREQNPSEILKIRNLELNRDTHEVHWKDKQILLRNKEFILLEFLMLNVGKLLTREIILESVWDRNANIFTNTVDVHINKLRKKIDYYVSEKFIHTVHCSGYIFS